MNELKTLAPEKISELRPISSLHNWEHNPRSISKEGMERLKKQITKLGVYKPLLCTDDGTVLGGNMRLKALQELGYDKVWVSVVKADTEEKKIEYALSDNDRAGQYEADKLADLVGNYPNVEYSNYSVDVKPPTNLQDLIDQYSDVEEDEAPAVAEGEPESKLGEVYTLGRHRLMCGDATKREDVDKLMDGKKADMIFTDPPYGVGYDGGAKKREELIGDKVGNDVYAPSLLITKEITTDDCSLYLWYADANVSAAAAAAAAAGWEIVAQIIWVKNNAQFVTSAHYKGKHEPCFYAHKKGKSAKWCGDNNEVTVWEVDRSNKNEYHPTQKPLSLATRAIKNSSIQDDIVLDLFGGSGSTLIACEQTNRTCYMMELDPKYCDVIRKRYENFIKK